MTSARNDARPLRPSLASDAAYPNRPQTEPRCSYECQQCGLELTDERWRRFRCPRCEARGSLTPIAKKAPAPVASGVVPLEHTTAGHSWPAQHYWCVP